MLKLIRKFPLNMSGKVGLERVRVVVWKSGGLGWGSVGVQMELVWGWYSYNQPNSI